MTRVLWIFNGWLCRAAAIACFIAFLYGKNIGVLPLFYLVGELCIAEGKRTPKDQP